MNPLFPGDEPVDSSGRQDQSYLLPQAHKQVTPLSDKDKESNPAVELIRHKIDAMYAKEPDAKAELTEVKGTVVHRSPHQQFMYELSTSGKSLAHIQTEWHNYYLNLSDDEKHQVWQEFYQANAHRTSAYEQQAQLQRPQPKTPPATAPKATEPAMVISKPEPAPEIPATHRNGSAADAKKRVLSRIRSRSRAQHKAKQHLQSLLFGLGVGVLALVIFLFGFFNEVIITPFIHPDSTAGTTPIILNTDGVAPNDTPEVIIPKISAQLPVIYGTGSVDEANVQKALEEGVIHYPTTALPGQNGNAAYFGHSSNNIFNKGQYKFAFVLLHELVPGDIFYLTHNKKIYTYRVYDKKIVNPNETWVLNPVADKQATATLITCDPPGTTLHRLVVWGEQITPDPATNTAALPPVQVEPVELPSNGPTLWSRFWNWLF